MHFPIELRQALLRVAARSKLSWTGERSFIDFFGEIMELSALPSTDSRFQDAAGDMWQHTENNGDWTEEDILGDSRFSPLAMSHEQFEKFLNLSLSIDTRSEENFESFIAPLRPVVEHFGFQFVENNLYGVFEGYRVIARRVSTNNQGRAHSKNPAPFEHAGLHFRS